MNYPKLGEGSLTHLNPAGNVHACRRSKVSSGMAKSRALHLRLDSALGETPIKFGVFMKDVVGRLLKRFFGVCQ